LGFVSGYLGAAMILDVLILMEIPWILFLLSLLSALGVITLLTIVYSLVWVMILKRENSYTGLWSLMVPLLGGYCVAILQIGAFDLVRFLMTGTWDGFGLF
jgi:hypothetical protein